jgi:hypothetical protein
MNENILSYSHIIQIISYISDKDHYKVLYIRYNESKMHITYAVLIIKISKSRI